MSPIILIIFAIVLILVAVIFLFRPYDYGAGLQRFAKIGKADADSDPSADTEWRSVKIRPGLICCKQVTALSDQLFLSKDAPPLPLPDCAEVNCSCHYLFFGDRRSGLDRRVELQKLAEYLPGLGKERRRTGGRRIGDFAPA